LIVIIFCFACMFLVVLFFAKAEVIIAGARKL